MWVSAAGAAAQAQQVDAIANNLANSDTLGYKKDLPTFKEHLATLEREKNGVDVSHGPLKDKDFYPLDGKDQAFVVVDGTHINFRQGTLKVTQAPLDVAFDGPGFLEVSTPQGLRYTRQGSLKVALDGKLVTSEGHPVLAFQNVIPPNPNSPAPATAAPTAGANPADAARFINLQGKVGQISVTDKGDLYVGQELVAKLGVFEFADLSKLRKTGAAMFENKEPGNLREPEKTKVHQGMLETSNVNPAEEMMNMLKANRLFEQDLKAMKTYGEMLQKEANDIGKL